MNARTLFDPRHYGLENADFRDEFTTAAVIGASGGKVVGRVRLQKMMFLLDKLGLHSGFDYAYHHYGPYSSQLSLAISAAKAFGFVQETTEHGESNGASFSIYTIPKDTSVGPGLEFFERENIKSAITAMNEASSIVLELAATAHWLKHDEKVFDWRAEIVRRKGTKTGRGRLEQALRMLEEIGLGSVD